MPTYQIKHSTELMENYQQSSVMAPQKEFRALATADGHALVFSIASDELGAAFTVTAEVTGDRHGWQVVDLSSSAQNPAQGPALPCGHFAVGQRLDGSVHLAMALRSGPDDTSTDTIFLAELTLDATGHVQVPAWSSFPYDGADTARSRVEVAGIFLSQATDGEYVIVDLVRDPGSPTKHLVRYYLDPAKPDGRAWHLHDVPIDLSADQYASVLGRRQGDGIDGVYVGGQIDGSPQIVYTPMFNELQRSRHPYSAYLKLSADTDCAPDALAVCPNPQDATTDLYAAGGGGLYRFASTNQRDGNTAVLAMAHPLFQRVQGLFAFDDEDRVVVWGRNADNLAFYTSCPRARLDTPGSWSVPLPILTEAQHVSPFANRGNRANTIVAHTGDNRLRIGLKSPGTGTWTWRDVTLPPAEVTVPARKINSYTTRIQVVDEHNQPAARVSVALSATNVTSVYINHLYYVIGPSPIHVPTDAAGSVTVVEAVPRLTGTQLRVSVADDTATAAAINPMDKTLAKSTSLQSVDQLRRAKVVTYTNGTKQPPRDLIRGGLDDPTLQRVADLNKQCAAAYAHPKQAPSPAHLTAMAASPMHTFPIPADTPIVDAGDLFQHMEATAAQHKLRVARTAPGASLVQAASQETSWEIVVRWFEDAWEFVVKIGEAIYRCVLTAAEEIISAVRWVYDKIVTGIEDLIRFLQFLFEWDDFKRTKDVIKNVTTVFLQHEIDQIPVARQHFDAAMDQIGAAIDAWGGVPNLDGLGSTGTNRLASQASTDGPDAPGAMLSHHFQGNVASASHATDPPPAPPASVFQALEQALDHEKDTLDRAFDQLRLLVQQAPNLTLVDLLKRLTAILGDAVVRSAQVVLDALLDILHILTASLLEFLDTPIHIPVLSDILAAIGIPDFSMLDVVCWVAAVPVTIGYKVATAIAGKPQPPFPDTPDTRLLTEAKDFATITAAFSRPTTPKHSNPPGPVDAALARTDMRGGDSPIQMSPVAQEAVFISLRSAAGVCAWVSAFLDAFESILPTQAVPKLLSAGSAAVAFLGGATRGAANALVPHYPATNEDANQFSGLFLFVFGANKVFAALAGKFQQPGDLADYRARGAWVDAVLVIPSTVITILHFIELGDKPAGKERTVATMDESSSVVTYVTRLLYTAIVGGLVQDEETKLALATIMGITSVIHGGIQFSLAAVEGLG